MISGEYEIEEQKSDGDELNTLVTFRLVTWESSFDNCGRPYDKTFENFEDEFRKLLEKYAI